MLPQGEFQNWVEWAEVGGHQAGVRELPGAGETPPPTMLNLVSGAHPDTPAWFPSPGSTQVSLSTVLTTSRMPDILLDPARTSASLSGLPQRLRCESAIFCCSVTQSCPTLCDPMDCSTPGFPVLHHLPELLKLLSIELVMPSNPLSLCRHPLLPLYCPVF